jgi:polar amino acid transport system substrate-binding protein
MLRNIQYGTYFNDAAEVLLKDNGFSSQIQSLDNDNLNAKKLDAGRIDLWIGGHLMLPFLIKKEGLNLSDFTSVYLVKETQMYIAFNKNSSDEVVKRWQTALDAMKADGSYDAIVKKFQ